MRKYTEKVGDGLRCHTLKFLCFLHYIIGVGAKVRCRAVGRNDEDSVHPMFTEKKSRIKVSFKKQTNITDATLLLVISLCLSGNMTALIRPTWLSTRKVYHLQQMIFNPNTHISSLCQTSLRREKQNTESLTPPKNRTEPSVIFLEDTSHHKVSISKLFEQNILFLWLKGCNLITKDEIFNVYQDA